MKKVTADAKGWRRMLRVNCLNRRVVKEKGTKVVGLTPAVLFYSKRQQSC